MMIDSPLSIQDLASLKAAQAMPNASPDEAAKIKEFAQGFESVFISSLLEQMSASVDTLNEDKDGAAKQIDGIFRMQLSQKLSESGSLGLARQIEQYMANTLHRNQTPHETKGIDL